MKKLISLLLVVLLALALCGTTAFAEAEATTIRVLALSEDEARWMTIAEVFGKTHPDINIEVELYPYEQLMEVIEVKLGSGDTSLDLIYVNAPETDGYVDRGYLMPIEQYFTEEDMDTWVQKSVDLGTVGDHFYAPPMNSSSQLLYFNKDLLDQAGVAYPESTIEARLTWEQVAEKAQAVVQALDPDGTNGIWGLAYQQVDTPYQILALPNSAGGVGVKGETGLEVMGVVNDEAWVKAMTYYYDLANTWKVMPKGTSSTDDLFTSGKLAFFVGGPWVLDSINAVEGLNWGYAAHPYFEGGEIAIPTDSWHLSISAFSQHPDETAELVHWMTCEEEGIRLCFELLGNLPCAKFLLQEIIDNTSGAYSEFPMTAYSICCYDELNYSVSRPATVGFREWDYAMTQAISDIRNGADPQETLDFAAEEIDAAFAKYR